MIFIPLIYTMTNVQPNIESHAQVDESLIIKIGKDDKQAFRDFYNQTERILYSYALSLTKHHEDALDIVHDTYIKIKSAAHLYTPMGKPLAWVFTIARNLVMTNFNLKSRTADSRSEDLDNTLLYSYVSDPTDKVILKAALNELNSEEAAIIVLYAVNGFKHREIAENLDLPINTVISKYNRGLKKLRDFIEKEGGK